MRYFPFTIAALDLGAAAVYLWNRQYALAVVWTCYAIAAFALSLVV
jgi:hypothetical protein